MRKVGLILVVVSLNIVIVAAQTPVQRPQGASGAGLVQFSNGQAKTIIAIEGPSLTVGCPVSLHAGHLADGSLVRTGDAHHKGIGQWLSLSLSSPDEMPIATATLAVRGLTPKGRVTQALGASGGSGDAVRTFHVPFSAGPHQTSIANLWVPGMSAVERIDLLEVDYGDGSTWKVADGRSCHVAPDPFMLITQR